MSKILQKYNILIADADIQLSKVLKRMLEKMGFSNIHLTQSGNKTLELLEENHFDFLITEWNVLNMSGIEMIDRIRRGTVSDPTLPIIMVTGRAEKSDVIAARDHGINEYVIKPYTARAIYSRLERLVEQPRQFVVSPHFVGPDRRSNSGPPPGVSDRRILNLTPQVRPSKAVGKVLAGSTPELWLPDYSLKQKLGIETSLSSIITPAVLNLAQAAIDSVATESLVWIRDNLAELKEQLSRMKAGQITATLAAEMGDTAITISSRAGTFGYDIAGEVSYQLYLFCNKHLIPHHPMHHLIIQKHIDVLQVALSNGLRSIATLEKEEVIKELKTLVEKYSGH